MLRPGYQRAISWIAANDDCWWVIDKFGAASVTACMIADLFGVETSRVKDDLMREMQRQKHPAFAND